MDEATALTRLRAMTAAASAPALSDDELAELVAMAQIADSAGVAPSDASWTPTYNLNIAAAEGWRWKAAQLAGSHFNFGADGASYNRSELFEHCEKMADKYARKIAGSFSVASSMAVDHPAEDDDDLSN